MKGSRSPRTKTHPYRNVTKKIASGFVDSDFLESSTGSMTRYDSQGSYDFSRDGGTDVELLKVQLAESIDEIHALKSRLHKEMMDKQALEYKNKELVEKLLQAREGLQETHNALYKVQQTTDELAEKDEERDYKVKVAMEQVRLKDEKISELQSKLLETEEGERAQNAASSYRKILQEKDDIIRVLEEQQFTSQNQLAKRKRENQRLTEEKADLEFILEMKVKRIDTLESSYKELQEKLDTITAKGGVLSKESLLAQLLLQALPANVVAAVGGANSVTSAFAPPISAETVTDPNAQASIEARLSQLEAQFRGASVLPYQSSGGAGHRGSSRSGLRAASPQYAGYAPAPAPASAGGGVDPSGNRRASQAGLGAPPTSSYNTAEYAAAAPGSVDPSGVRRLSQAGLGSTAPYNAAGYSDPNGQYYYPAATSTEGAPTYTNTGYYDPNYAASTSQAPIAYAPSGPSGYTPPPSAGASAAAAAAAAATTSGAAVAAAPTGEAPVVETKPPSPVRRQSSASSSSGSRKTGRPTLFAAAYKAAQKSSTNLNGDMGSQRSTTVTPNTANGGGRRSSAATSGNASSSSQAPITPVPADEYNPPSASVPVGQANGGWEY